MFFFRLICLLFFIFASYNVYGADKIISDNGFYYDDEKNSYFHFDLLNENSEVVFSSDKIKISKDKVSFNNFDKSNGKYLYQGNSVLTERQGVYLLTISVVFCEMELKVLSSKKASLEVPYCPEYIYGGTIDLSDFKNGFVVDFEGRGDKNKFKLRFLN